MFRKAQDYCKYSVVGDSCWLISMATRFSCFLPWLLEMMLWKLIVTGSSSTVTEILIVLSKNGSLQNGHSISMFPAVATGNAALETDRYRCHLRSDRNADCTFEN